MILVVGASGYLGGLVCRDLQAAGQPVRAMVRSTSNVEYLRKLGVELVYADLNQRETLPRALAGCTGVIFTASSTIPTRRGESPREDGVRTIRMIDEAKAAGVKRFVFVSALSHPKATSPLFTCKAPAEDHLMKSGLEWVILRPGKFMEMHAALLGTDLPMADADGPVHTLQRPFAFSNWFFGNIKHDVQNKGVANVDGSGTARHAWVSTSDVSKVTVRAYLSPAATGLAFDLGAANLSQREMAEVIGQVVGRRLKVKSTPTFMLRALGAIVGLFMPASGVLLKAAAEAAVVDLPADMTTVTRLFPDLRLETPEEFLRARLEA